MIIGIRAFQDKGKSALAIAFSKELVLWHGYDLSEVISNVWLNWPGSTELNSVQFKELMANPNWNPTGGPLILTSRQLRAYVHAMVSKAIKHKIIIVDEADRVFPARFWHDQEQTEALIGLWQDVKLFNTIIYTAHEGTAVDIILKNVTQIEIEPLGYNEFTDTIPYVVFNALTGVPPFLDVALDVSKNIFPDYDRWKEIGVDLFNKNTAAAVGTGRPAGQLN